MSNNTAECGDDIWPNQNVKRSPWVGESPILVSMFSLFENDLDFLCVYMFLCVHVWWWWYGMCVCLCIYSRSWWVRTQTEREWWLTSQLMTNPYPACNSTPVVRYICTHTYKNTHLFLWNYSTLANLKDIKSRRLITLSFNCNVVCNWFTCGCPILSLHQSSHPNVFIVRLFILYTLKIFLSFPDTT